jgi:hypothetical protein
MNPTPMMRIAGARPHRLPAPRLGKPGLRHAIMIAFVPALVERVFVHESE